MSNVRTIAKNLLTMGLAQAVSTGLSLVLVILITRFIGDAGYGELSFAMSLAATLTVLTPLGLDQLLIREVARQRDQAAKYLGHALLIQLGLGVLPFAALATVITVSRLPAGTAALLYLTGGYFVCINLSGTLKSVFRAYEKMEYDALITSARNILTVAAGTAALLLGYGLIAVAGAYLAAALVELAATVYVILRYFATPRLGLDPAFLRRVLPMALPFAVLAFLTVTYTQADVIVLKALRDDATVGWYRAALAVISAFSNIPAILSSAIFPAMARFHVSSREFLYLALQKSAKLLLTLGLPISTGLILLAQPIVSLFYGADFLPAVPSLRLLALFIPLSFLNSVLGVLFSSIDKQHLRLSFYLCSTLARLALDYFLILHLSLTGAAVAVVVSEALLFALNYYVSARQALPLKLGRVLPKPFLASLGMALLVFLLRGMNLLLLVGLAAVCYFALFIALGGFDAEDRAMLGDIWKGLGKGSSLLSRLNGTK